MRQTDLPEDVKAHYPWEGCDLTLSHGHRLHYLDEGEGEVLLMVHGNPTWSFYYRTLVKALSDEYRCIVPDHMGCGLSDKPQDWGYRLQDHIDNLVELIDHLDLQNVTLVVHDWGGAIGFGAAVARSERIKRLVVFNTAVFMENVPLSIRLCRYPGVGEMVVRGLNGFVRIGLIKAIADRGRMKNGVGHGYTAPYNSYSNRVAHLRFIRDIPIEDGHPTRKTIDRLTKEVPSLNNLPTVFMWGCKDFVFTPKFLDEYWVKMFPNAEVHKFEDAAHFVVEDAHERIVPIMKAFLNAHPLEE